MILKMPNLESIKQEFLKLEQTFTNGAFIALFINAALTVGVYVKVFWRFDTFRPMEKRE
jgi:hypothetical protein